MRRGLSRAAVVWLGVIVASAAAQEVRVESTEQLPEVVVTATRTRLSSEDVTSSVTVVNSQDIEQHDHATVAEALRGTPGLDLTEFGSTGHSSFASIRGAAPDQVLVLLDGVEVNTATVGQFDFANLTTDNVDRIEIVRGGGGTLYGSNAIGGVINVLSRRGEGPFHLTTTGEAGSAATHHETVGVSGARGPFALSGTTSFLASDGFRSINDDYRNFSTSWRADADPFPNASLRGFLRYSNSRTGLVNFNVADGVLDPDARSRDDFFLAKGEWEHRLQNGLNYRASASYVSDNQRFHDDELDSEGEVEPTASGHFPNQIIAADTQLDYLWRDLALTTVGLEFKERSARVFGQQTEEEGDGQVDQETEQFNANRSNVAVYGQEQLSLLDDTVRGVGGLRYDHYDGFSDQVTASGSGSYLVRPTHTRLRLGYAEGFRAPTFDELFQPTLGNPNLQAETSWEIDAGAIQEFFDGRLRFEPTYFYREVKNLIEEVADQLPGPIAGVPEGEGARNVNARFQGVELITRAQPMVWLTLSATYTYLNFDSPQGSLLNRPRHRGSFSASTQRNGVLQPGDRATAAVQVFAVGARDSADPTQDFEPRQLGSYGRTDLALSYRLDPSVAPLILTATVRNLFNRDFSESIGFPAPPARFLMGFRYRL